MYQPSDNIKYSMTGSTTLRAGSFEIAPATHWELNYKPNWRTRTAARIFLGWKWRDNQARVVTKLNIDKD